MNNMDSISVLDDNNFLIRNDNEVFIDNKNNVYCVIARGKQTIETANAHKYLAEKIFNNSTQKLSFLINVNECGKNCPEARKTWKYLTEHHKTKKVAVFGVHPVAKVIAYFVIGTLINREKIHFFNNQEDALEWLKK